MPGTEVAFERPVEHYEYPGATLHVKDTVAVFTQINVDVSYQHHDALEFPDGATVLLTALVPGQQATVLQLPVEPAKRIENKEGAALAEVYNGGYVIIAEEVEPREQEHA